MGKQQEKQPKKQNGTQNKKKQRKSNISFKKLKDHQENPAQAKNLLTNLRKYHVQFAERMGKGDHILVKKLNQAQNVNMRAYQQLYNDPELRQVYKKYFKTKQIYRDLNRSRINIKNKITYIKYLDRFEEAFNAKKFQYITK